MAINRPNLRTLALSGQALEGWESYETLTHPSAFEDRWGGFCLMVAGKHTEARTLFEKAFVSHELGAAVHLAYLHRINGECHAATRWLNKIEALELDAISETFRLREQGLLAVVNGDIRMATNALEEAWVESFGDEECAFMRPGIAQALGFTLLDQGEHRRAVESLDRALDGANPFQSFYAYGAKAVAYAFMGEIKMALQSLEAAQSLLIKAPDATALLQYQAGTVARAAGELTEALEHFKQSAKVAQGLGEDETEAYAELGRCAAYLALSDPLNARRALARARFLAQTSRLKTLVLWRQGCLDLQNGAPEAETVLEQAYREFVSSGYLREAGWAGLWMAEAALLAGRDAGPELEALLDTASALGDAGWTGIELAALPRLKRHLEKLRDGHDARILLPGPVQGATPVLELRVLGEAALYVNGRPARTHFSRIAEFVYYLIRNPSSSIGEILRDLFPDEPPQRARNYVHQMRNDLHQAVKGLTVQCDAKHRYSVQYAEVEFTCDAVALEQHLERDPLSALMNYQTLLPLSEGEWAAKERERLMGFVMQIGLKCLNQWFEAAEYARCVKLTERLLEVDPFDTTMSVYLLEALYHLEGKAAAQQRAQRMVRNFDGEGMEPPQDVVRFSQVSVLN
jgi:tetratricopeptide (TPR) repeat protein